MSFRKKAGLAVQVALAAYWLVFLIASDSYYMPYLVVGAGGLVGGWLALKKPMKFAARWEKWLTVAACVLFSAAVCLANYALFTQATGPVALRAASFAAVFAGGCALAWNLLCGFGARLRTASWPQRRYSFHPAAVFFATWLPMVLINCAVLFSCKYPGCLTPDGLEQILEGLRNDYYNHHPVYLTFLIRLVMKVGFKLFGEINGAVAFYHVFQICVMAGCFALVALTLYQMHFSLGHIAVCALWYTLLPYHIMYSFSMLKDVLFGGMVLVLLLYTFRVLKGIGRYAWLNYSIVAVSGIGMCLFRTNGLFAYFLTAGCFALLFYKKQRKLCLVFLAVLAVSWALKHPVLQRLHIPQTDTIEALSIPAQQIARVVVDCGEDLTSAELESLEKIIEVERIPAEYKPYLSDSIKELVRVKGNQDYLTTHKKEYLRLYLGLGLRHPWEYVKAWADQTRGYWNGGYDYWRWWDAVWPNDMGIERTVFSESAGNVVDAYLAAFSEFPPLTIFLCIGFHVWLAAAVAYCSVLRRNKAGTVLFVPVVAILASLLIATPVFSEFRYVYAVFCCLPFQISVVFYKEKQEASLQA